jgi:hypothetical protein
MKRVSRELKAQQIALELTEDAKDVLAKEGFDSLLGARPLRRTIQRRIENPLASKLLRGEFIEGDVVVASVEDGKIVFEKKVVGSSEAGGEIGGEPSGGAGETEPETSAGPDEAADGGTPEA